MDYNDILDESSTPVEDANEKDFRNYIMYVLLLGRSTYLKELENYKLIFDDIKLKGSIAYIDAQDRTVTIERTIKDLVQNPDTPAFIKAENEDLLSMLIRHELLHSILDHHGRAIIYAAKLKGYNPNALSHELFEKCVKAIYKPSLLYRRYNGGKGVHLGNGAGDLELSKMYIERDKELQDIQGGLILEDQPELVGKSYEEILTILRLQEKEILRKLLKRAYGTISDKQNFKADRTEDAIYDTVKVISLDEISGIRILRIVELEYLAQQFTNAIPTNTWLMDLPSEETLFNDKYTEYRRYKDGYGDYDSLNNKAFYIYDRLGRYSLKDVDDELEVYPVLDVPTLDLHKNIKPGQQISLFGLDWIVLPTMSGLLSTESIFKCKFNLYSNHKNRINYYRDSVIKDELEDWLESKRGK